MRRPVTLEGEVTKDPLCLWAEFLLAFRLNDFCANKKPQRKEIDSPKEERIKAEVASLGI